jgi:hypothetical protein
MGEQAKSAFRIGQAIPIKIDSQATIESKRGNGISTVRNVYIDFIVIFRKV